MLITLEERQKQEEGKVPRAASRGCDYLLNRTGEILYAPNQKDLERRIDAVVKVRRDIFKERTA